MRLRGTNRNFRRVSNQQVPFNPKKLFRNGEQGVHYDPSDFSRYMQTGPETVSNGTFDTGTVGWTQALGSISAVGGRLRAARSADGASAGRAYTAIQCVPGKTYLFKVERYKAQTGGTTVRIGVLANGSLVGAVQLDTSTVDGFYRTTFVATQAEHYVILESGSGTSSQYAEFDNVSVQELIALDTCTLFQDSAGTTPVTAVEQPVGLMLDKSKGLVRGGELATATYTTPAGFDNVTTSLSNTSFTQVAGTTPGRSYVTLPVTIGAFYEVSCRVVSVSTGTVSVLFRDSPAGTARYTSPAVGAGTVVRFTTSAFAVGTVVLWIANTAGASCTVDSISIKEIPGNHAFQTTAIDRPVLSNRYNLLTKTEQFDDAVWVKSQLTVTPNATVAPDGTLTADTVTIDIDNASSYIRQGLALPANTAYVFRIWVLKGTAPGVTPSVRDNASGTVITSAMPTLVDGVWQQVSLTFTTTAASTYNFWIGRNGVGSTSLWGASLVPADQASLPYQRVNTATDYDSDPSKFPLYLSANGTNSWMQTNSIDFTGTDKATVFAGIRKLSDVGSACFLENSTNSTTTPGTFSLFAPLATGPGYAFRSRGTALASAVVNDAHPSPDVAVLTGFSDISGDSVVLRRNGTQVAQNTADQGTTSNYGNYPLYLFRRGGTSLPFNGRLYCLLIRGALTSDPDILKMERWLALKTGVQL